MNILFLDLDQPLTRYCSRMWSIFSYRNGLFSPLERAQKQGAQVYYSHPDQQYEHLLSAHLQIRSLSELEDDELKQACAARNLSLLQKRFDEVLVSDSLVPQRLLEVFPAQFLKDIEGLQQSPYVSAPPLPDGVYVLGDHCKLYVHPKAEISPGVVFDLRGGPVVVDHNAMVGGFSHLVGPVYVGPSAQVSASKLVGPVSLGIHCRIGGEVEATIVCDYSNKHHEGFLGHSMIGRWVNLGALVTTSDLKNNYGVVRLQTPDAFISVQQGAERVSSTDTIKFGSVISDCVKVAIGAKINTGSVLDMGSNVFGDPIPKFLRPFSWGLQGERYNLERFFKDCDVIFKRRQQHVSPEFVALASYLHAGESL